MFLVPEAVAGKSAKSEKPLNLENYDAKKCPENQNETSSSFPFDYCEPEWSQKPSSRNISLEMIKNGVIIQTFPLYEHPFYVLGRWERCDIVFEHPSVSRFHAILQHRGDDGIYMYDLNSTHGTKVNKRVLSPKTFEKVEMGQMIQLGLSSRLLTLQGGIVPCEIHHQIHCVEMDACQSRSMSPCKVPAFSDFSDSLDIEMEERQQRMKEIEQNSAILWFMKDPRKALSSCLERENIEYMPEFTEIKEAGLHLFHCRFALPSDFSGECLFGEGSGGKKKEAEFEAILDACKKLYIEGSLDSESSAHLRRIRRKKFDADGYESDEDSFFDRTGELESKRRKRLSSKNNPASDPAKHPHEEKQSSLPTFESLTKAREETLDSLAKVKNILSLNQARKMPLDDSFSSDDQKAENLSAGNDSIETDAVDDYLNTLHVSADLKKNKLLLHQLEEEISRLDLLIEAAKPSFSGFPA